VTNLHEPISETLARWLLTAALLSLVVIYVVLTFWFPPVEPKAEAPSRRPKVEVVFTGTPDCHDNLPTEYRLFNRYPSPIAVHIEDNNRSDHNDHWAVVPGYGNVYDVHEWHTHALPRIQTMTVTFYDPKQNVVVPLTIDWNECYEV
jgi:hypothetical protein